MRLTDFEVEAIVKSADEFVGNSFKGILILFGSRTDDKKLGGDIDLALIAQSLEDFEKLKKIDYKIVASIKMKHQVGDQRIDFKVLSTSDTQKFFFVEALKDSVVLKRWD